MQPAEHQSIRVELLRSRQTCGPAVHKRKEQGEVRVHLERLMMSVKMS